MAALTGAASTTWPSTLIDSYATLDGFTDESGVVNPDLPRSRWDVTFADLKEHTLVTTVVHYNSPEDVQKSSTWA
jgi:hypothetical protein